MIKNYLSLGLLGLFNLLTLSASAQQDTLGIIKGTVIDSITAKPAELITIVLKKDNIPVKTIVTDASGLFFFEKVAFGKYTLTAIAIGYNAQIISLEVSTIKKIINLDVIKVFAQNNNLKEVSVTADRPLIKQEIDRISYDIQADPENKVLTALDMMRKVPLLSLDADDNIKLKGSGNYKILINGKASGMMAMNPKDVLRSMPASSIQKIEVITTPPAKYDSEGLAGIINIITSKKIADGYNGSVNLRGQTPVGGPGLGGSASIKEGKIGITVNGGTGFYHTPETENTTIRVTTGENPTSLLNMGTRKLDNNYRYAGVEVSYEIDSLNLITSTLNPYSGYTNMNFNQVFSLNGGTLPVGYNLITQSKYKWNGLDAAINYQLGFRRNKEQLLTFSYRFTSFNTPQKNNVDMSNPINYADPSYTQQNDSRAREQTLQIDYVQPFKKLIIEAGVKGILRDNNSNFEYKEFDQSLGDYLLDPSRTNTFNNNQDILGAYNSYAYNLKNWGFKAGVRMEGTFVNADFESSGFKVNTNYFNVIPTVSINHKFEDKSSLNFGYTQRIERPGINYLNPFIDRSVPNFESTGNPDLRAVLSNNLELNYSQFKKVSVSVGAGYNFANNTIQQVSVYDPQNQITQVSYLNIGKDRTATTNLNITYPVTNKWNISANGSLGYIWLQGLVDEQMIKNSGVTGYGRLNTGYNFEHNWKANASISYSAANVMLQGKSGSYSYLYFSGSKDIIKDKLTVSAVVVNPFANYRYYTLFTQGYNFTQNYSSQNRNRWYTFSINWRFGELKDAIKKNKRNIDNDDVKAGGNKTGG